MATLPSWVITILLLFYLHNKIVTLNCLKCADDHKCKNDCYILDDDKQLCLCNADEKGVHCTEKWNMCEKDCNIRGMDQPCSIALCRRGKCIPIDKKPYYTCECGDFYTGKNCEIENNPCSSAETNPCLNGTCLFIAKLNRVICKCHNGWTQKDKQSSSMLNWGTETVEVPPPCDGKCRRAEVQTCRSAGMSMRSLSPARIPLRVYSRGLALLLACCAISPFPFLHFAVQITRGLSKYVVYHTPAAYAMWWLIYVISVLVLFLCCCNVCFDFFSSSVLSFFTLFGQKKKD
ncbi:hypothetical protein PCYB_113450 [Plasmodium cynomolgi strain B]|uniref:EGF-like domain-containing protein n=1 Tax=Plasmodium cynomolgi (strain B) TaxID=1120755 RepID=K6UXS8_PLACD|nr:hypothetical protein PCYB_113450 [Plasmodium cynomolgi strain B]GAB67325.1 hypothetical protein PCYB_113450 [Plasmodium cynomolgi strain B]